MKIITISREFGSGGRELGKRLADQLGYDYYDREIITAIAQSKGLHETYVEDILENNAWQAVPLTFRRSFRAPIVMQTVQIRMLEEQKKVLDAIADAGKDSIIVGRNADVILADKDPFRIFVCADRAAKIQRCIERAERGETLSPKEIERNMRRIDKNRAYSREIISDSEWGDPQSYHITVNTTGWNIKDLVPLVADFAKGYFKKIDGDRE